MHARSFSVQVNPPNPLPIAIADFTRLDYTDYYHGVAGIEFSSSLFYVNRVNVPMGYRGRGFGSQVLQKMLDYSDEQGLHLILDVVPSGEEMGLRELIEWYERHGFIRKGPILMYRPPLTEIKINKVVMSNED